MRLRRMLCRWLRISRHLTRSLRRLSYQTTQEIITDMCSPDECLGHDMQDRDLVKMKSVIKGKTIAHVFDYWDALSILWKMYWQGNDSRCHTPFVNRTMPRDRGRVRMHFGRQESKRLFQVYLKYSQRIANVKTQLGVSIGALEYGSQYESVMKISQFYAILRCF